jgi:methylated-DNA-[protein]-cysteine S-methyltransferase
MLGGCVIKHIFFYDFIIGRIAIVDDGSAITDIFIADNANTNDININDTQPNITQILETQLHEIQILETQLIKDAAMQLNEYLLGKRMVFDVPLAPIGTEFQKRVWAALVEIPYGETRSYKQIAQAINNPLACRGVGGANNKNPIMFMIPCHRVIGANGSLVGYAEGLDLKQRLLNMEKKNAELIDEKIGAT